MRPKNMPVKADNPRVNRSTLALIPISPWRGISVGLSASIKSMPQMAMSVPSAPPSNESNMLSVNNCLINRTRPAPSAVRMAISFCREDARANSSVATLAQATSSTKLTAASNTSSAGRTLSVICSSSGTSVTPIPLLMVGCSSARLEAIRSISARAWSTETSGFNQPIKPSAAPVRLVIVKLALNLGLNDRGSHTSALR